MSLATFKKKSVTKSLGTKRSGKPPGGYWLPQGPFVNNKIPLNEAIKNYGPVGFSLNGTHRNKGGVGKEMKMSKSGTPYRGTHPIGWGGTYGRYPSGTLIGNGNEHSIIIQGQNEYITIEFALIVNESVVTGINIKDTSNIVRYPILYAENYNLADYYDYYRKDYIDYYICNLTPPTNNIIITNRKLYIVPRFNNITYTFNIKAVDSLTTYTDENITFRITEVNPVDDNKIITTKSTTLESKTKDVKDIPIVIDLFNNYNISPKDSNIFDAVYTTNPEIPNIRNYISLTSSNMKLVINPTHSKKNYNIEIKLCYKDSITNNQINNKNISIRYQISETGVFSFYTSDSITISESITLTDNNIIHNLTDKINLHYTNTLFLSNIILSNVTPISLRNAYYKTDITSNAYILDQDSKIIKFNGEYRNTDYIIIIDAYFDQYPTSILRQIFNITEEVIPEIALKPLENSTYTYLNQSTGVIYLSNIIERFNYVYSDKLLLNYTVSPSLNLNANPYSINLTNDTLRIDTDYRELNYIVNVRIFDSNFQIENININIDITEIAPFDLTTKSRIYNNLKKENLPISLTQFYNINTPVNKTNTIDINNSDFHNITISGSYTCNIENNKVVLTFDYRTILTIKNNSTIDLCLTTTNNSVFITDITNVNNIPRYFKSKSNDTNITDDIIRSNPLRTIRNNYIYKPDNELIWDTKNVEIDKKYYIIDYNTYIIQNGIENHFIIQFIDFNDTEYHNIIKTISYDTTIRKVINDSTIYSNLIVQDSKVDNLFYYNSDYRNTPIPVSVELCNINYPNQTKTINYNFIEQSIGDIIINNKNVSLFSSNRTIIEYDTFDVYCNYVRQPNLIYTALYPNSIEDFVTFDNSYIVFPWDKLEFKNSNK
jgi:hypothetical protein